MIFKTSDSQNVFLDITKANGYILESKLIFDSPFEKNDDAIFNLVFVDFETFNFILNNINRDGLKGLSFQQICKIANAADFFQIKSLISITVAELGTRLKCATIDEVQDMFLLEQENRTTQEDIEKLKNKHRWTTIL